MKGIAGVPFPLLPGFDPVAQGALFYAASTTGNSALYLVPPGAYGIGGCGPTDGWKHSGNTYTYLNSSGATPPGCFPSSANGLRKAKIKDDRAHHARIRFTLVANDATLASTPGAPALLVVGFGGTPTSGDYEECSQRSLACVANKSSQTCR
jgi:hypothetical protein